jgi:hypothetical protein
MSTGERPAPAETDGAGEASTSVFVGPARLRPNTHAVAGGFADLDGADAYRIQHYDRMPPFFISLVSAADHWLFISSNGALTAGRRSPEHVLFPYTTVDKIHDAQEVTGSKTLLLVTPAEPPGASGNGTGEPGEQWLWEPFSDRYAGLYAIRRALVKGLHGDVLRFEEANDDLGLTFSVTWCTSERYGFVKRSALRNHGGGDVEVRVLDGLQNLMPYGIPRAMQNERSVLADAYKKNELLSETSLGLFTLSAQPVDRPEPSEALRATTVWSAGLDPDAILLSSCQLNRFRAGEPLATAPAVRAERGAYFVHATLSLAAGEERQWVTVAEIEQDAADVVALADALAEPAVLQEAVEQDVLAGRQRLRALVAAADGLQLTADRMTTARHYTNVLFNVMRGGVFDDGYDIEREALRAAVAAFNAPVAEEHAAWFDALPKQATVDAVLEAARTGGPQLERLCHEYLPLIFSRRHGDPSRPWNHFTIDLRAEDGSVRRGYQGNWRDIFQNWEALGRSFPAYLESMIAKFVNASTADGYNPYRITQDGIDWEVIDPDDPWSHIGYWGDHQIIYLLALLELAHDHYPARLAGLLSRRTFAYANVPYRIQPYADLLCDPHHTIDFDAAEAAQIDERVAAVGADGKLLWQGGEVALVPLAEKLLVPLLAKLTNFIPGGGIWMNTQRPEWNDANNALVGYGVSMVTLYQIRRYLTFLRDLFGETPDDGVELSAEVGDLLYVLRDVFERFDTLSGRGVSDTDRKRVVDALGEAGSTYREGLYANGLSGATRPVSYADAVGFVERALGFVDGTIGVSRRDDGLFHAYNLLSVHDGGVAIAHLYAMLEGQVAVLGAGVLAPEEALKVLAALRQSALYRPNQHSYLLYPDRDLPGFLEKNLLPADAVAQSVILRQLLADGNRQVVVQDVGGGVHFNGDIRNSRDLEAALDALRDRGYAESVDAERGRVLDLFERVFDHRSYTGRSGTFFGYEGLGSIYWHMVSKLVLAVQQTLFDANDHGADPDVLRRLADAYYDVRAGLGLHKTPAEYGAFPTDPYSHTPAHAGAKQPGMTGQVKEDILCRWGELGVRVVEGDISFDPLLLRASEFLTAPATFRYVGRNGAGEKLALDAGSLAFTCCQVPVVYRRATTPSVHIRWRDGRREDRAGASLGTAVSGEVFGRTGAVERIEVALTPAR